MYDIIRSRIRKKLSKLKTRDFDEICNILGIDVKVRILPPGIKGIYYKVINRKYIKLNLNMNDCESRTVLAHEISHAILHKHITRFYDDITTLFNYDRIELEANILAAELLIPDEACNLFELGYSVNEIAAIYNTLPYFVSLKFTK